MASRKNTVAISALLLTISIAVIASCGSGPGSDGTSAKSSASLDLIWPEGYSFNSKTSQLNFVSSPKMSTAPAYVTGCRVTISGADMTPITLDVPLSTGQISGSVMPGVRRFDVVVSTDFGVTFTGSTTAVLTPGPNGISIQLAVNAPPTARMNVSNASPKVGEAVTVSVAVTDPDVSDTHIFTWNGGGGSISGSGSSVTWVGNLPGSYTVSVTVDDGHGGVVTQSVGININNTAPVIQYVRADKTQVVVGAIVNLACFATDADGDLLAYSWSDGLGWSATGQNAAYTVKSSANPSITFTCEVNDGNHGGTAKGTVTIGSVVTPPTGTWIVTKTADTNDGVCDADCSLREAISAANASAGGGTINIPAGTYTITIAGAGEELNATGDFDIAKNVAIVGAGSTTINGGALDRVFNITGAYTVAISGVTIKNGIAADWGGGIYNNGGALTVTNSTISGNSTNGFGGGIKNGANSALTVTNSTISGNTTNMAGGGIYNDNGAVTVTSSTISGNSVADGGGIYNNGGAVTVTNSTITGNTATGYGGGIDNDNYGTATVTNSTITGNTATNGGGGGIYSWVGVLTVTNSTISGNTGYYGGGIFSNSGGALTVTNSTITSNTATYTQGGGGGIYSFVGTGSVTNSTISSNSGVYGGGILNFGVLTVTNSTISSNSATTSGGGINRSGGTVTLSNTIVANQTLDTDCAGAIVSAGHNLESAVSCGFAGGGGVGGLKNTDPILGALANNGGATQTMALSVGSPAIDAGSCVTATDQRGIARPQGVTCDIGAYEY